MIREIQIFLDNVEKVLNGRTLFITIENLDSRNKIENEQLIKNITLSKELDLKLLDADLTQQDGDFFHELTDDGKFIPKVHTFHKSNLSIYDLEVQEAHNYLVSMLTAKTNNTFWSPYNKQLSKSKAKHIVDSFLDSLGDKDKFNFYKLNTNFIFQSLDFWDQLGSDSITVILADHKIFFLFTNGGD